MSFLSLQKYLNYIDREVFSYSNEHLRNCVEKALRDENLHPFVAVLLKNLSRIDEAAKKVLAENYKKLFTVNNEVSLTKLWYIERLVFGIEQMNVERLISHILYPDNYNRGDYLEWLDKIHNSYLFTLIKNENLNNLFKQLILCIKNLDKKQLFSDKEIRILSNFLKEFGQTGLNGLYILYRHDDVGIQLIALRSIVIIYRTLYGILNDEKRNEIRNFLYRRLELSCIYAADYSKIWSEIFFIFFSKPFLFFHFNIIKGGSKKHLHDFKQINKRVLRIQKTARDFLHEKKDWEKTLEYSGYLYQKYGIEEDSEDFNRKWAYFDNRESKLRQKIRLLFEDFDK